MAGYDRWGDERDRDYGSRERGRGDWGRREPYPDRFAHGGREYHSYGHDRGSMGGRDEPGREWDSDYRSSRYGGGFSGNGRREDGWGGGRNAYRGGGRSVGEMAFGRDQSGRDDPGEFGRRHERDDERGWLDRAGETVASWFGADDDEERIRGLDLRGRGGEHRGRGPKSYQRSDERILEDVNDRLTDDPHLDASDVEVSVSGREVTLTGTVASRFDKRRAEDLADGVSGVIHVHNNLRVRASSGSPGWSDERISGGTDPTGMGRTDRRAE